MPCRGGSFSLTASHVIVLNWYGLQIFSTPPIHLFSFAFQIFLGILDLDIPFICGRHSFFFCGPVYGLRTQLKGFPDL